MLAACGSGSSAGSGTKTSNGAAAAPTHIVFAAVPSENNQDLANNYRNVIHDVERDLHVTVTFKTSTNYAGVVEGMRSGKIDVAGFGPLSYVIAQNQGAKIEPIAAEINVKGQKPGYYSYGITSGKNTSIKSIDDFKGKKVCFVDPQSTSGYLYPLAGLIGAGIDPAKDITPTYAGAHDRSVLSVANGSCDVGFAEDIFVDKTLLAAGQIHPGDVRKVWTSPQIPGSPVAVRSDFPASFKASLKAEFAKFNVDYWVKEGECTTGDTGCGPDGGIYGYAAANDADYAVVRKVCATTKAPSCRKF